MRRISWILVFCFAFFLFAGYFVDAANAAGLTYTVWAGDTLYKIGQRYGVTATAIQQANGLKSTLIYPNQKLYIPGALGQSGTASRAWSSSLSREDMVMLAKVIYAESRGEPYAGQVAVGAVVLNRLKNPDFPKTVEGIIYQRGAFSSVSDGQINLTPNDTAFRAAQDAANGWDPSYGALFFFNPAKTANAWMWSRPIITTIGHHVFTK